MYDSQPWRFDHHGGIDARNGGPAALSHGDLDLFAENVQDSNHALLTVHGESPKERTTDEDGPGPQRQGFHHVGAAPNAAIEQNLHLPLRRRHGLGENLDGRHSVVEMPCTGFRTDQSNSARLSTHTNVI